MLREGRARDAQKAMELLAMNGGASSGRGIGAISWNGDVHPDQFWRSVVLGSVRERDFSQIWHDPKNTFLAALKDKTRHLVGRCADCRFIQVCGGGLRARAWYATGEAWGPDPACYLTDEEIGLDPDSPAVAWSQASGPSPQAGQA
jgi:radical SAM protein with 4Fe4S-binding SPASM domain